MEPEKRLYVSKRNKVKTKPFELDDVFVHRKKSSGGSEAKTLVYSRNEFLAVRNDTGQ